MTTAAVIIQAAFREGNLITVGKQPGADHLAEALDKLNRLVRGILGYKMGENLSDWMVPQPQRTAPVAANFPQSPLACDMPSSVYPYPPNNTRIVYGGTTLTVYFPQKPNPGSQMAVVQGSGAGDGGQVGDVLTLNGNGRTIETTNTKTFAFASPATAPKRWFYRDDLADWVLVEDLDDTDELPYPQEFDDFFVCALAKRLAPSYGKIIAKETIEAALTAECAFYARYRQPTDTVYGSDQFPRTYQSYVNGNWWW
jgi:hypothetical protein